MAISTTGTFRIHLSGRDDVSLASFNYLSGQALPDAGADIDADGDELLDEAEEPEGEADERVALVHAKIATAGEPVASSASFMRGHGSYLAPPPGARTGTGPQHNKQDAHAEAMAVDVDDGADPSRPAGVGADAGDDDEGVTNLIYSALAGPVIRTNKLVSVRALRARYAPEVGDLVVGRIVEVQPGGKRWKVDINGRAEASLLLSSINLPGGVQRKKLESDELQMRAFFKEGDLLVAEVQAVHHDGSVGLHTRSLRYGKLRNGLLVPVQPQLVQRLKSHFVTLSKAQVDLVAGMNGYIWVAKHIDFDVDQAEAEGKAKEEPPAHAQEAHGLGGRGVGFDIDAGAGVYGDQNEYTPPEQRVAVAQVAQLLALLSDRALPISDAIVERAYELWTVHLASRRTTGVVGQAAFYDCTPAAAAQQRDTLLAASREAETLIAGSKGDELVQALYRSVRLSYFIGCRT